MLHYLKDAAAAPVTGQAVEIVKQILDKLADAAKTAQTTVEAALPHVVRAYMMRQIGYMVIYLLGLLSASVVIFAMRNRPMSNKTGDEPSGACITVIIFSIIGLVSLIGVLCNTGDTFAVLGDPIGAFILNLINK